MESFGFILHTLGTIMVAITAIRVHRRVWQEHKIDQKVFTAMRREQKLGITGIVFIIVGSVLQFTEKFL